jgi:hypothetical protein
MALWDAMRQFQAQHVTTEADGAVQVADIEVGLKQPKDRDDGHRLPRIDSGRVCIASTRGDHALTPTALAVT